MTKNPVAKSQMLIRKPVSVVFEALVNPEITSEFWFTRGSARMETGKTVVWEWGQFGVEATIHGKEVKQNRLIVFQWPTGEDNSDLRTVEISFETKSENTTFVQVIESGLDAGNEQLIEEIVGQTEGWTLVLSAMKAYLEYGINLNLISDHNPEPVKKTE